MTNGSSVHPVSHASTLPVTWLQRRGLDSLSAIWQRIASTARSSALLGMAALAKPTGATLDAPQRDAAEKQGAGGVSPCALVVTDVLLGAGWNDVVLLGGNRGGGAAHSTQAGGAVGLGGTGASCACAIVAATSISAASFCRDLIHALGGFIGLARSRSSSGPWAN